jgi:hypothetical protein
VGADDRDLRKMITSSPNYSGGSRITWDQPQNKGVEERGERKETI